MPHSISESVSAGKAHGRTHHLVTSLMIFCYWYLYCSDTLVRPGGLTLDVPLGVSELELNQGDDKSGRIARADVADICVNAIYR